MIKLTGCFIVFTLTMSGRSLRELKMAILYGQKMTAPAAAVWIITKQK